MESDYTLTLHNKKESNDLENIIFERITKNNFNEFSLDNFNRYQDVTEVLRFNDGKWTYVYQPFTENWNLVQLRERALWVLELIPKNFIGFIAKNGDKIIGLAYLGVEVFGSDNQYIELEMYHVSYEFRNKGIGKKLFNLICDEARKLAYKKLYISTHSSKETQEAYKSLGCVHVVEINNSIADNEPFDVQMEYVL